MRSTFIGMESFDVVYHWKYSLLFNTSHGILIREKWDFPPNPFIPAWSLSKSLLCLLLHPGLKPFLFTWKQWWCHCYINRGLLCSVFQPGLWVNGMACLVIQTCFWKKSGMSPNTTWLVLKRKEYHMGKQTNKANHKAFNMIGRIFILSFLPLFNINNLHIKIFPHFYIFFVTFSALRKKTIISIFQHTGHTLSLIIIK